MPTGLGSISFTLHPVPVFSYNWAGLNLSVKLCGWSCHSVLHYIEFLSLLLFSMIQIRQWNQYISSIKQCTVCIVLYITILYYRIKTNNNVDSSHKKITMKHYPYFAHFRDNFPCYWNRVLWLYRRQKNTYLNTETDTAYFSKLTSYLSIETVTPL